METPTGDCYTGADLEQWSARAANTLVELGLEPGDRVAVVADKSLELLWLYLGCLRAGCVYHPLNPTYTETELAFFLRDSASRLVVCENALLTRVTAAAADSPSVQRILTVGGHGVDYIDHRWQSAAPTFATQCVAVGEPAALLYSSGTTGKPKGIPITHGNLLTNAQALVAAWAFSGDDILVHALPLYHVHGLFITLGPALLAGTRVRFLPRFEPGAVIAALAGATMMAGVPTYYTRLLNTSAFTRECCASVRVFISGSAPLSEATFSAFEERTGQRILERYGMTETGINTSNPLHGMRKPGSVGPPLAGVALRIVDDGGKILGSGAIGNIEVHGPNVFGGYRGLPETTAEAFTADGYFRTGDQGYLDADGYLHIVGRSKDMIITGGLNVYPKEIERELESCAGVIEAAVFGVPHADYGEAVVAAVVGNGTSLPGDVLIGELKTRLAGYKVPKQIVVVDDLPRNSMGKVQKNLLRERHAALFEQQRL